MSGNRSRNKGQSGEREIISLLQPIINSVFENILNKRPPVLKRNLMQSLEGGCDIIGLDFLSIEVKRQEKINIRAWWRQTLKQTLPNQIPVLFYRPNRSPWNVIFKSAALEVFSFHEFCDWLKKELIER